MAFSILYKLILIVVGLMIPRLFILNYGSELNGLVSSVALVLTYIGLVEAGVGESSLQAMFQPAARQDRRRTNEILSATTVYYNKIGTLYFVALFVLAVLYPIFVVVKSADYLTVFAYILLSGMMAGVNLFLVAKIILVMNAEGDTYIQSIILMITFVFASITKIICMRAGANILIIQASYLITSLAFTGIYIVIAKKKYPWLNFRARQDFGAIKQKDEVLIHKISGIVFQNADILTLTLFCDLTVVSIYMLYKMIGSMIDSMVSIMGESVNYILGQTFSANKDKKKYCALIDFFNVYYSAIAFALYSTMFILMNPFLRFYTSGFQENYIIAYLPYLYIIMALLMVSREAMLRTITVAGFFKQTIRQTIIETAINLIVSIAAVIVLRKIGGNILGLYGVLTGTIVALVFRTIIINTYANKKILERSSRKTFKIMMTNCVLGLLVTGVVQYSSFSISSYVDVIKYGCLFTVAILILFLLIHSLLNQREFKMLYTFLGKRVLKAGIRRT